MKLARLVNPRHPVWSWTGVAVLGGCLGLSALFVVRGPRPLKSRGPIQDLFGDGVLGRQGTITEQLGQGRFVLSYATIRGSEEDAVLSEVKGRLEEPETLWSLDSPSARRKEGRILLDGPMSLEARPATGGALVGQGRILESGPALGWDHGVWKGHAPLRWENLEGQGRGIWHLPRGWRRDLAGRLDVDEGLVSWEAKGEGALHRMEAHGMSASARFEEATLREVTAFLEGGRVTTARAEVDPHWIRWFAPITFQREDGWVGEARQGLAPRPAESGSLERVELAGVKARRPLPDGEERMEADGVRWTTAGLRLEGRVSWEQPLEGRRMNLRAPRVLFREGPGDDLPADLPKGEARAEGQAVLTWGGRSLSSPRIDAQRAQRRWRLAAPVLGRGEDGTFSAGQGYGEPRRWVFDGPVTANLALGGSLRGDRLVWEEETWTLTGHPASLWRLRERMTGPRILRKGDRVQFPDGLSGTLAGPEGDLHLQAGRGETSSRDVALSRGVELRGQGWRLQAERISANLGPGSVVTRVQADGHVQLRGQMGEGTGEALELDLKARTALWKGRVRGRGELVP